MAEPRTAGSGSNALLERFPADVRRQLDVTDQQYESHDVLIEGDELPRWVYFPYRGTVISLTRTTENGTTVEVGIVGWEGVAAVQCVLLPRPSGTDAVVQIAGGGGRVRLQTLRAAMNDSAETRELLLAFAGGFLAQVSQHATCNRVHTIEQRLAKWLLGVQDRIDTDEMGLTHDFLSHMLGTRRAGATVAIGALSLDGLIEQRRGGLCIIDREGLEERACECYGVVREMLLPPR
jgi:CRP-like cAMP-binding protein